ncbi:MULTISPECIES: Uma2 family endonuclease [unclassified Moorena]|uniref:Uma2 family endonuclease n=1 Tax=unclassified Moorena TaxID=2683338 RepID=UPI0013FFC735|nr:MULTISPECIES: Uma2 family endonuclease [unclassified Moorena]NEO11777.1 Uma2 family endonuclease [Moorena sp. SIO3E8]NEP98322.1 Uma2 family endonuclease [Moorena sp. SIO3F7]
MTETVPRVKLPPPFPEHTQLPESDGTFVFAKRAVGKNFQEHPQSIILTDSIGEILQQRHPDGEYAIGQDCGIYWRETDPPEKGAEAPDWFYVPNVPPQLDGKIRRSYVVWREHIAPLIALEFASGNGDEERDKTPLSLSTQGEVTKPGKFWVYEQIIRIPYYGIYQINNGSLEVYTLVSGFYQKLTPNERGHYYISPLGVELGLWQGSYQNQSQLWLRWWDEEGNLLLIGDERAVLERERAEQERQRAEQAESIVEEERQRTQAALARAARLAEQLRAAGIDPDLDDTV